MKRLIAILILTFTSSVQALEPSYFVFDQTNNEIVVGEQTDIVRPMASLTKLMTALLVIESTPNWNEKIKYRGNIFFHSHVTKRELLESLLIRSDNNAAEAFANNWYSGRKGFINDMNTRARQLGMLQTVYADPSGLDKHNVSTAIDLSKLVAEAAKHNDIIEISSSKYLTIERKIRKKISYVSIGNTNKNLLFEFDNIILSKTGWTNPAGRCLALMVEKSQNRFIIIILGEKTVIDRENRARQLINNYVTIKEKEVHENRIHLFNF